MILKTMIIIAPRVPASSKRDISAKVCELVYLLEMVWLDFMTYQTFYGSARGVVVIVVGNEHGDSSSNPGRD